jgi:hypothetical protein
MTSHTGTTIAAPAWVALREAHRSNGGGKARRGERREAPALGLRVRGRAGREVAALGALVALWAVLWTVFLVAVASPAASAHAALTAREGGTARVASAAGDRP